MLTEFLITSAIKALQTPYLSGVNESVNIDLLMLLQDFQNIDLVGGRTWKSNKLMVIRTCLDSIDLVSYTNNEIESYFPVIDTVDAFVLVTLLLIIVVMES